jgi:hypothetical protein
MSRDSYVRVAFSGQAAAHTSPCFCLETIAYVGIPPNRGAA